MHTHDTHRERDKNKMKPEFRECRMQQRDYNGTRN